MTDELIVAKLTDIMKYFSIPSASEFKREWDPLSSEEKLYFKEAVGSILAEIKAEAKAK